MFLAYEPNSEPLERKNVTTLIPTAVWLTETDN